MRLYSVEWSGASKGSGAPILVFIHGFAEHSGRYKAIFERLKTPFFKAVAYDARGHGRSQGTRGYVDKFETFVDDLEKILEAVHESEPARPIFLLGHSMGGLVLARFLLRAELAVKSRYGVRGAAFSSPYLGLKLTPPPLKFALAKLLRRTYPSLQLTSEINPSHLTHQPSIVEAYVNDRLVHDKITPGLFFELEETARATQAAEGPIGCPLLFLVAGDDRIVDSHATKKFYENLKHRHKEWVEFPGLYHEIFNETDPQSVDRAFLNWVNKNEHD